MWQPLAVPPLLITYILSLPGAFIRSFRNARLPATSGPLKCGFFVWNPILYSYSLHSDLSFRFQLESLFFKNPSLMPQTRPELCMRKSMSSHNFTSCHFLHFVTMHSFVTFINISSPQPPDVNSMKVGSIFIFANHYISVLGWPDVLF